MFKPHSFWLSLYSFEMPCNYHAEATITIEETTFVVIVCRLLRRHRFSSLPFLQCSPVTNAPRIDHFATRLCLPPTLQFLVFDSDFVVTRFFFLKIKYVTLSLACKKFGRVSGSSMSLLAFSCYYARMFWARRLFLSNKWFQISNLFRKVQGCCESTRHWGELTGGGPKVFEPQAGHPMLLVLEITSCEH